MYVLFLLSTACGFDQGAESKKNVIRIIVYCIEPQSMAGIIFQLKLNIVFDLKYWCFLGENHNSSH